MKAVFNHNQTNKTMIDKITSEYRQAVDDELKSKLEVKRLKQDLLSTEASLPVLYDNLTTALAQLEAGNCKQSDVDQAQREYDNGKKRIDDLKLNIDVATKVLPLRATKVREAFKLMHKPVVEHLKAESTPIIKEVIELANKLDSKLNEINSITETANKLKVDTSNVVPFGYSLSFDYRGLRNNIKADELTKRFTEILKKHHEN